MVWPQLERGQVVISVEAKEELLASGEKLIVFGKPSKGFIVMMIKEGSVAEFLNNAIETLGEFKKNILKQVI